MDTKAGEDLTDIPEVDEEEGQDESSILPTATLSAAQESAVAPLLGQRRPSKSRSRRLSVTQRGDATVTQAVFILFKSFIGTGVLFLGKAFSNGGILFSSITLVVMASISLYSYLLLVKTKFAVSGSFGDIGGTLYGPWMRYAILFSITISQIGFVAAYVIFVSENFQAIIMAFTNCTQLIPVQYFILLQFVIFVPLVWIRDLAKLSSTALIADAFIVLGLLYIFSSEIATIAADGIANVELFNPKDFPLFVGTAAFSFEGICLIIPITDSMREPRKFPAVLTGVVFSLLIVFGGAGMLGYLAFGTSIQPIVLLNLDSDKPLVQITQFFYSLAILLSGPITLFPAIRIMEHGLFTQSGKEDSRIKWMKNVFRVLLVGMCVAISWVGAADLDKFAAFVGCFTAIPLCYIYPAMLHYKACARTRRQKVGDIALAAFGVSIFLYTTSQTIQLWFEPDSGKPRFGNCGVP